METKTYTHKEAVRRTELDRLKLKSLFEAFGAMMGYINPVW